jgi:hypothetical protein
MKATKDNFQFILLDNKDKRYVAELVRKIFSGTNPGDYYGRMNGEGFAVPSAKPRIPIITQAEAILLLTGRATTVSGYFKGYVTDYTIGF